MKTEILFTTDSPTHGQAPSYSSAVLNEQIFVASGNTIIVTDINGKEQRRIKTTHSEISQLIAHPVQAKIVSLGFDNSVIFNDIFGTALFKYTHTSPLQCGCFSKDGTKFLSCSEKDIGIYIEGNSKVNKIAVESPVRSCAFSQSGEWFVIALENGQILMCDLEGKCFNKVKVNCAVWCLDIVNADIFEFDDVPVDENEAKLNNIGIFTNNQGQNEAQQEEKKMAQQFIDKNKIIEERVIFAGWDQKLRIINPGCLQHTDILFVQQPSKKSFKKQQNQNVNQNQNFLIQEIQLDSIPLAMTLYQEDYLLISGVSANVEIVELKTGKILKTIFQANERFPEIACAPYSKYMNTVELNSYNDRLRQFSQRINQNTLSYAGINNIWAHCLTVVDKSHLIVCLSNGSACCVQINLQRVTASFNEIVAERDGLCDVKIKNFVTNKTQTINTGIYVKLLRMAQDTLFVISDNVLKVYKEDQNQFALQFTHKISFPYVDIIAAPEHIIIVLDHAILTLSLAGDNLQIQKFLNYTLTNAVLQYAFPDNSLLIGTVEGVVMNLSLGKRFPNQIIHNYSQVARLNINSSVTTIGLLDNEQKLGLYNMYCDVPQTESKKTFYNISDYVFDSVDEDTIAVIQEGRIIIYNDGAEVYQYGGSKQKLAQNSKLLFLRGCICVYDDGKQLVQIEIPQAPQINYHLQQIYEILQQQQNEQTTKQINYHLTKSINLASQNVPIKTLIDISIACLYSNNLDQFKFAMNLSGQAKYLLAFQYISELAIKELPQIQKQIINYIFACILSNDFASATIISFVYGLSKLGNQILKFVPMTNLYVDSSPLITQLVQKIISQAPIKIQIDNFQHDVYVKLGADEQKLQKLQIQQQKQNTSSNNNLLDFLDVYDQNVVVDGSQTNVDVFEENQKSEVKNIAEMYQKDYRIQIRNIVMRCINNQQKQSLLQEHAQFLLEIHQFYLSSLTYFENEDYQKAVEILINNNAWKLLTRLLEVLPPLTQGNQSLTNAYKQIMQFSLQKSDFRTALIIANKLNDINTLIKIYTTQHDLAALETLSTQYPIYKNLINQQLAAEFLRQNKFFEAIKLFQSIGDQSQVKDVINDLLLSSLVSADYNLCRKIIKMQNNNSKTIQQNLLKISCLEKIDEFLNYMEVDQNLTNVANLKQVNDDVVISCVSYMFDLMSLPDEFNNDQINEDKQQLLKKQQEEQEQQELESNNHHLMKIESHIIAPSTQLENLELQQEQPDIILYFNFRKICIAGYLASLDSKQFSQQCLLTLLQRPLPVDLESSCKKLCLKLGIKLSKITTIYTQNQQCESPYIPTCVKCNQRLIGMKITVPTQKDINTYNSLPSAAPSLANICKHCGCINVLSGSDLSRLDLILITYTDDLTEEEFIQQVESVNITQESQSEKLGLFDSVVEKIKKLPCHSERLGVMVPIDIIQQIDSERFIVIRENNNTYVYLNINTEEEIVYNENLKLFENVEDYEREQLE